jgi:hypothetical protein
MVSSIALGLGVATSALADPVGGSISSINTLTSVVFTNNLTIVAANGLTNAVVVSGTINNNDERGWDLSVSSANLGKLVKGAGGAGREIAYNNIEFVSTGGTLGLGLSDPSGTKDIAGGTNAGDVAGTTHFFTHTTFTGNGTATSATLNYTFQLRISAAANTSLLSGTYSDNITLLLSNDS